MTASSRLMSCATAALAAALCLPAAGLLAGQTPAPRAGEWRPLFNGRSLDVFISKLRKYLSADKSVEIINVHGKGYKLVVRESSKEENHQDAKNDRNINRSYRCGLRTSPAELRAATG